MTSIRKEIAEFFEVSILVTKPWFIHLREAFEFSSNIIFISLWVEITELILSGLEEGANWLCLNGRKPANSKEKYDGKLFTGWLQQKVWEGPLQRTAAETHGDT